MLAFNVSAFVQLKLNIYYPISTTNNNTNLVTPLVSVTLCNDTRISVLSDV